MRIAVIANSVFPRDYGQDIDRSDVVVRFNRCESFASNSGRKTTIIAFCNTGKSGLFFTQDHILNAIPCFAEAKEIWLPRNPAVVAAKKAGVPVYDRSRRVGFTDHSGRIIAKMGPRKTVVFDAEISTSLEAKFKTLGARDDSMPSTGMLAIEYLLERVANESDEIALYGFSHKGINAHDWDCERLLIEKYVEEGLVVRGDDAAASSEKWIQPKAKHWTVFTRLSGLVPQKPKQK